MSKSSIGKKWEYPIDQDYGLGDEDNGINDIPTFMVRMMLQVKANSSGNPYEQYVTAFKAAAKCYYLKGAINIMKGTLDKSGKFEELDSAARKKTIELGQIEKLNNEFRNWVKAATKLRNSQQKAN